MSAQSPGPKITHEMGRDFTTCGIALRDGKVDPEIWLAFDRAFVTCAKCLAVTDINSRPCEHGFYQSFKYPCPKCLPSYPYDVNGNVKDVGVKHDSGKPNLNALCHFELALAEVAKVIKYGAKKYPDEHNWKKVANLRDRYCGAGGRHNNAYLRGTRLDESGIHTLAHAICDFMFVLQADLEGIQENE